MASTGKPSLSDASDEDIIRMVGNQEVKFHELESRLKPDFKRAVEVRREFIRRYIESSPRVEQRERKADWLSELPHEHFDYSTVFGRNAENVVGYVPIPIGVAGPILMDGKEYPVPMATTEGALIASTHRGARCVSRAGGCTTAVLDDGMTRAPLVELESMERAAALSAWFKDNLEQAKAWFSETTRFGKLHSIYCRVVGRKLYCRFRATTGDAMGMNMISKGTDNVLKKLQVDGLFPDMKILSLSGNFCTDKKPSAVNWIEGRGKSVIAEAVVPEDLVRSVLKSDVDTMVQLNVDKNLVGSAMAGSIGGFNAHAANAVAAIFLATGQDPAQVVESSTAITVMEKVSSGPSAGGLRISVTMPSIEVGTIGGGTGLPAQRAVCELIGCAGASPDTPGRHSELLARVVCSGVLCAELSLMAGLAAGHLVRAHLELNRK
eukprot:TRINITY_DN360_c0_g5_i1.p1 TRINITY_DN360_c0_g5~~TRINITY_DN360_c0_g5_i1.p1  ORF type:complete len:490 (+),score=124.48 TRINITY_DN360_c0_g5_i1:164-1471(+)